MFTKLLNKFVVFQKQQKAIRELSSMTDSELADIGTTRTMISQTVRGM